jgi:serine/threonine protein kinase
MGVPNRTLDPARWKRVRDLFDRCAGLDPAARARLLDAESGAEPWLREEVEALLRASGAGDGLLGPSLIDRAIPADPTPTAAVPAVVPAAGAAFPPRQLGKYLLFHLLGRGGMAEVYLAKMRGAGDFERLVAVKRILPGTADRDTLRRFEHEANLSSRLTHANIVHVYDFGEYEGTYLLAMEFVNGVTLRQLLDRARSRAVAFPIDLAAYVVAKAIEGLDYAHRRTDDVTGAPLSIIHRDVTPNNVIVSFEGDIKMVDFGIAKAQNGATRTQTGLLRGTAPYLSPEAFSGRPVEARSDIFSVCAIAYELLHGQRLFPADNLVQIAAEAQDPAVIASRVDALPVDSELRSIVRRGLAPAPESRPSAAEMRRDLEVWLRRHGGPSPGERLAWFIGGLCPDEIEARRRVIDRSRGLVAQLPAPPGLPEASQARVRPARIGRLVAAIGLGLAVAGTCVRLLKPFLPPPGLNGVGAPGPAGAPPEAGQASFPPPGPPSAECAADAERLCPGKQFGTGLFLCLRQAVSQLSDKCLKVFNNYHPPPPPR